MLLFLFSIPILCDILKAINFQKEVFMKKKFLKTPSILLTLTSLIYLGYTLTMGFVNPYAGLSINGLILPACYTALGIWGYFLSLQPGRDTLDETMTLLFKIFPALLGGYAVIGYLRSFFVFGGADSWTVLTGLFGSLMNLNNFARMIACFMLLQRALSKKQDKPVRCILLWMAIGVYAMFTIMYALVRTGDASSTIISFIMMAVIGFIVYYFGYVKPTVRKIERSGGYWKPQKNAIFTTPVLYQLIGGIVCLIGSFIVRPRTQAPDFAGIGIGLAGMGTVIAISKKRQLQVKNYSVIDIPANWPTDCFREDYKGGIGANTIKPINSSELRFYQACVNAGINNIDSESGFAKAELIAQQTNLKGDVRQSFIRGEQDAQLNRSAAERKEQDAALRDTRIKEYELLRQTLTYYGLHGTEKRKAMLEALRKQSISDARNADMAKRFVINSTQQKEVDWAVIGGAASGIGGFGAGLAAAMDAQAKNAEIRAQNARNMPLTMAGVAYYNGQAATAAERTASINAQLQALTTKLVGKDTTETVFAQLHISDPTCATTETGAVVVEATFSMDPAYRIYGDITPVLDGCVAARILQNGEHVGSAYFVFPLDGIAGETRLQAICTKTTNTLAQYSIRFEAVDLWAMEK